MCWLLLMVMLSNAPAFAGRTFVLQKYATQETCDMARAQIGFEMADAYPYERNFQIVCKSQLVWIPL